jgi:hypothetical protein
MYKLFLDDFNGLYLNCEFKDGISQTDNINIVNYFKRHNLKYQEIKPQAAVKKTTKKTNKVKED